MEHKLNLFIALDVETKEQALSLVEQTHSLVLGYKLGPRLFLKHKDLIDCIKKYDSSLQVFLDFKFYDIPSSTIEAVKTTYDLGADLVTIHASVGAKTLEQLNKFSRSRPRSFTILPVTVLSSVEQDSNTLKVVQNLADMVVKSGLPGLVCSPLELPFLREKYPLLYLVTPGIRFEKDNHDDQKRVMTPQKALQLGSSALVMGRSLTQAKNPLKLLETLKIPLGWTQEAAEQGDAMAQYNLGVMYSKGEVVAKDLKKAFDWYMKAADQGNAMAQYNLGVMYSNEEGLTKNPEKAIVWLQKAAEQGHADAQYNLGVMYRDGVGVTKNPEKAFDWYEKAAEQGHADAQYNLGEGVTKNFTKTFELLEKADQDYADAQSNLEDTIKNFTKVLGWSHKVAKQDYADAQYNLEDTIKNFTKVLGWPQEVVKQDYAVAQSNLEDTIKNFTKALGWSQEVVKQNYANAQFGLEALAQEKAPLKF